MIRMAVPCCGGALEAEARFIGRDLWVVVLGGDSPHLGSVSIAIPRESLTSDGSVSATVSTFNVTGHKDDIVGDLFAKRLSSEFNCKTSVTCGIHFDHADSSAIGQILRDADILLERLAQALRRPT